MKLKKINAVLSLLSILLLLMHLGYSVFAYFTFYYNPLLTKLFAVPFMVTVCLHAILGMSMVFLLPDGTRMDLYPRQNFRTILQRVSAALIFPLLILHINTFDLLKACAANGRRGLMILLFLSEPLFYGTVLTHTAVSLTRAFVTLGLLTSRELMKKLDLIIYLICAAGFAAASWFVLKGQIAMFMG